MKSNSEIKAAIQTRFEKSNAERRANTEAKHQKIVKFVDTIFKKYSSIIEEELIKDGRVYFEFETTGNSANLDKFLIGMEFRRRFRDLGYDVDRPFKGYMCVRLQ